MTERVTLKNLKDALAFLDNGKNWYKGGWFDYDEEGNLVSACASGALRHQGVYEGDAMEALRPFVPEDWHHSQAEHYHSISRVCNHVPHFNDDPTTQWKDIAALYKRAIAHYEAAGD